MLVLLQHVRPGRAVDFPKLRGLENRFGVLNPHLAAAYLFNMLAKIDILHVPYSGAAFASRYMRTIVTSTFAAYGRGGG